MRRVLLLTVASALIFGALACGGDQVRILDIEPRVVGLQGDQPVKILGQNFRTDIGYTVYFGSRRAKAVTILDPQTIVAYTPQAESPETVTVNVRMDDGHAFQIVEGFRFEDQGGSVVEALGEGAQKAKKGNLAF